MSIKEDVEHSAVLHAAVEIANEHGISKLSKLDACHEVAKRVLQLVEKGVPDDIVNNVTPIHRRTQEVQGVSDYDVVRMRTAASAMAMFGMLEAA